jgi:hypothetical protein
MWWHTTVIPLTQEAETRIWSSGVQGQPEQNLARPCLKNKIKIESIVQVVEHLLSML